MRLLLVLALVSLTAYADHRGRFERFCSRTADGRTNRGFPCTDDAPAFSAFASNGVGTFGACSTTPPTGARGEVLTFARASTATCQPGGAITTGIADSSFVTLSSGQPRVESRGDGVLGLRFEPARDNLLTRFIVITNAIWSDVGTPTLTGGQTSPWVGTYATSAVSVTDDDAAAYEGRSQTVTVTSGQPYTMHCAVKANGATSATIDIDGTAAAITGLSATTWGIVTARDAAASSTSITARVLVGNATSVTGSVIWGGCQVELGATRTSMIPTDGTTASRAAEGTGSFPVAAGLWASSGSAAFSSTPVDTGSIGSQLSFNSSARILYSDSGNVLIFDGTNNPSTSGGFVAGVTKRYWSSWSTAGGWVVRNETDANQATSAFTVGTWTTDTSLELTGVAGIIPAAIVSDACLDPSPLRCR